ncbi:MAG TPA: hypothetical protein VGS17_07640 [Candidatus Limnocylindria bacterium]|nr:hypothetical protein [Candidatus Limnocylindria bacterium]
MDTLGFTAAHEASSVRSSRPDDCACDSWSAPLVAAQVSGTDRLITDTAARILFGTKLR